MSQLKESIRVQRFVLIVGAVLLVVKFLAWFITHSVSILGDALESIINVLSAGIGLYSLYLASIPRDHNHPYGHGKVEFISSGIEGGLITMAGISIIYEAIQRYHEHNTVERLDEGLLLILFAGIVNFVLARYSILQGKKSNSVALVASGQHLMSDIWTTVGILLGLLIVKLTGINWLDSLVALIFAVIIIVTGYKIIRKSIAGIMDEADKDILEQIISIAKKNRRTCWIDIHNLRVIKYGSVLHIDVHLTLPWYMDLREAHDEIDILEKIIKDELGDRIELMTHVDFCLEYSCRICEMKDCKERKQDFQEKIEWNLGNVVKNAKHN